MARNKGLGRGLDAIFDDNSVESTKSDGATKIRISLIEPKKDQPRKTFDREALASLADSIAANGVLQPILVRESIGGMYSIIAGERRWRASKMAGLSEIPAVIIDADELAAAKYAMIENLQREDLDPTEEARGYAHLMDNFGLTQEQISVQIGKSRSAVANSLRLLDLPEDVLRMVSEGTLSAGHGRTLLGLRDKSRIGELATRASARRMSVRELEAAVKAANKLTAKEEAEEADDTAPQVNYLSDLEEKVSTSLGRRCRIISTPKKKTVQLEYTDDDDLQALLTALCGHEPIVD
ncbi:MAG: ParB/RepB/Spo0J family partition protein [Clostridia bacterium]|nr:ParB/RepB/Spo0J family partition protein [Clostridia bacterium]